MVVVTGTGDAGEARHLSHQRELTAGWPESLGITPYLHTHTHAHHQTHVHTCAFRIRFQELLWKPNTSPCRPLPANKLITPHAKPGQLKALQEQIIELHRHSEKPARLPSCPAANSRHPDDFKWLRT